jgi:cyclopropane fatty-acyl-phospholipid synthase-like methyltransferase
MKRDMRKIVEEGYDKGNYAGVYRADDKLPEIDKFFLKQLMNNLPEKSNILDFGCGVGLPYDKYFIEQDHKITGIDISQKHISEAKKNVPKGKFIKGDFSSYDFGKKFDAIVSFYAIFHIPREEHKDLFKKIFMLLKDSGRILITLGTGGDEGEEEDWCGSRMAWSQYKPEKYKKLLEDVGFKILEAKFEGQPGDEEYHYWVFAEKKQ